MTQAILWISLAVITGLLIQSIIKNHFIDWWNRITVAPWKAILSTNMLLRWLRLKGFQSEIVDDTIIGINDGHRNIVLSAIPERRSVAFCEILELEEDADVQIAQKAADKLNDDFLSRKFDVNQDQRNLFIVFDCYMANPIWFFRSFNKILAEMKRMSYIFEGVYVRLESVSNEAEIKPRMKKYNYPS